jgi:hypothetical protein
MAGNIQTKADLAKKKAFELSYALFRISSKSGNSAFKEQIEKDAVDLLDCAVKGDYPASKATLEHIDYFIGLGLSSGIVGSGNAEILFKELKNLNIIVSSMPDMPMIEDPEIASIFSIESGNERKKKKNPEIDKDNEKESGNPRTQRAEQSSHDGNPEIESGNGNNENNPETGSEVQTRREAILKIIRQSGNCRIKDMQDSLPDVSDRTIRYDLEIMIHDGLVERIGSGPGTYYKIPENRALAPMAPVDAGK